MSELFKEWMIHIAMAAAIFFIGRHIAKFLVSWLKRLLVKSKMDDILVKFISQIANAALLLFIIIAALDQLGVDTTSMIAILGAAGLAVGLALQGSLQNFAAGVMLIVFRPFKAGDFIEAGGTAGVVETITIFTTVLRTGDNREVVVPNGNIFGGTITNNSARPTRRIDMVFGIGYDDDIKKARDVMLQVINEDERVLKDPAPLVAVAELGNSSVNFNVRPWVNTPDYWTVRFDLIEKIKLAFDANEITIPYPQMDVHLDKQA
jgi:small conductance mechanosensitive channel